MIAILLLQVAGPVLKVPDKIQAAPHCPAPQPGERGEVTVCAHPNAQEQFRLRKLPDRYVSDAPLLPKAETTLIGKAKIAGETEQAAVGGWPSNRAMVRVKVPF